jgi:hypothetical protein
MKHVWTVRGAFLHWELTVKVRPAEDPPMPITERDQASAIAEMKHVGEHFLDTANLHEYSMELEALNH